MYHSRIKTGFMAQIALFAIFANTATASSGAIFDACQQHYYQRFEKDLLKRIDQEKMRRCTLKSSSLNDRLSNLKCEILIDSYRPKPSNPTYLGKPKSDIALRYAESKCEKYRDQ